MDRVILIMLLLSLTALIPAALVLGFVTMLVLWMADGENYRLLITAGATFWAGVGALLWLVHKAAKSSPAA